MGSFSNIDRGPDRRPPAVIAASERILIGHGVFEIHVFLCSECNQSGPFKIEHLADCQTGMILEEWDSRVQRKMGIRV